MKKIYLLFFIIPTCAFADSFTLTYYDNRFYDQTNGLGSGSIPAGGLTFISDIYYYFKPFEKQLQISQTEWLSDGYGNDYVAPYSPSTFDYYDVSFDNITSEVLYLGEDYNFVHTVLPAWKYQYAKYVTTQTYIPRILNTDNIIRIQNRQILNAVSNHQNIRTGRNGGDTQIPVYVWAQTLYSHGNKRGNNAFSSDTLGTLFGTEIEVSKNLDIGFGYGYSNTDSENTSMNSDSYFMYGDYKTKSFFINAVAAYNSGEYKYSTNINNGQTDNYFASAIFGTNTEYGFSEEIGVRYNNIKIQDNNIYKTTIKNNTWTGTLGTKYKYNTDKFTFGGKVSIDYDFYKSNDNIDILILNQTIHLSEQNKDKPLGIELGAWAGYGVSNIDLQIEYDLFIQSDFINHTGKLSFKYGF